MTQAATDDRWSALLRDIEERFTGGELLHAGADWAEGLRGALIARGDWAALGEVRPFSARWDQELTPLRGALFHGTFTAWLRLVSALDLHWTWLARPALRRVAAQGDLAHIEALTLSLGQENEPRDAADAVEGLREVMPWLKALRHVELYELGWLGSQREALGRALAAREALHLSLAVVGGSLRGAEQLGALIAASQPLRYDALYLERISLAGDLLGPLCLCSRHMEALRSLHLNQVELSISDLALSSVSAPFRLESLTLERAGDRVEVGVLLDMLASARGLDALGALSIAEVDDGEPLVAEITALGQRQRWPLRSLSLRSLSLYDAEGLGGLLAAFPDITSLALRDQLYDAQAVEVALASCACLQVLDLRGNALGVEGARALLASRERLMRLEHLIVYQGDIGEQGLKLLADSAALRPGVLSVQEAP